MPLPKLSPAQLQEALRRIIAGEPSRVVGRDFGVSGSTLRYHMAGGKSRRALGAPWRPHLKRANRHLAQEQYSAAARELRQAAAKIAQRSDRQTSTLSS